MEKLQAKIVELERELDEKENMAREYRLFLDAIDRQEYPLYLHSCAEEGCEALEINDGGRGINVVDGCENMTSCDDCGKVYYCQSHRNKFNIIPPDESEIDETEIYLCNSCFLKDQQEKDRQE